LPLLGSALVLSSLLGYWSVYRATTHRSAVLVLARPLRAGARLSAADLRVGELAADHGLAGAFVPDAALGRVTGQRLVADLPAGTPLSWALLQAHAKSGATPAAFTLVVPLLHALGGSVRPGERVSVLATFHTRSAALATRAIAEGLAVLAVSSPAAGADPASATIAVTVALPRPALASTLALAGQAAALDLVRDGATPAAIPSAQTPATG
jgi:Flp pilus assembly protein CpaB